MQSDSNIFVVASFGSKGRGSGKNNGKSNGKRRKASLRQSGSAFGAALIGRAEALPFRFEISLCIAITI